MNNKEKVKDENKRIGNADIVWEMLFKETSDLLAIKYNIEKDTARMILYDYLRQSEYPENNTLATIFDIKKRDALPTTELVNSIAAKYRFDRKVISSYLLDFKLYTKE